MAMQKIEFEFPEPSDDETEIEIEGSGAEPLFEEDGSVKTNKKEEKAKKKQGEEEEPDDVDIEVVDDTPPEDRGREPSEPPDELTEEELNEYAEKVSEKARKRLLHFSKGYHDERRAKEAAQRERAEFQRYAEAIAEENKRLKGTVGDNQNVMLEHAKKTVERDLNEAKREYKVAYEAGDPDAIIEAQEKLTTAKYRSEQLRNLKERSLQPPEDEVQRPQQRQQSSPKAAAWANENTWFGQDQEMTALALGYHTKLIESGVDPDSDEYYGKLNARMRQVFPDQFGEAAPLVEEEPKPKPKQSVVAPATRSVGPKKVKLTTTQVAVAKRLGVPLEDYAKQVAELMRKENG